MLRVDNLPTPQPLLPDFTHHSPDVVRAYSVCRAVEHLADHWQDSPCHDGAVKKKLVNIRILGHLLSQSGLLLDTAISKVAEDILSSQTNAEGRKEALVEGLDALGESYRNYFIRPFRKYRGKSRTSNSSRESLELTNEEVDRILAEPRNADHDTLRKLAMKREDYRCIVTRILDYAYALRIRTPEGGMYEGDTEALQCSHVLPVSTNEDLEQSEKRDHSATPWILLDSFRYTNLVNHFAVGDRVRLLENMMAMTEPLRHRFDTLRMWFEPVVDAPNCYRIRSVLKLPHGLNKGQLVSFQSAEHRLLLPNRESLCIHAACCGVAHLSGASSHFDDLEMDINSDPDPILERPEFVRALHTHLEHPHLHRQAGL